MKNNLSIERMVLSRCVGVGAFDGAIRNTKPSQLVLILLPLSVARMWLDC
jgi:hypothetical protein